MLSILISTPSGTFIYPRRIDISTIFSILLPETATLRPFLAAASIICCTLCTFDAKVATIIRLLQPLKICSNFSPTLLSLIAYPGRSTFVLSERTARTPSFPSSPSLARSIISPTIGVVSILKSPIWITVPTGVLIARAAESAIEWLVRTNSTEKFCPALITFPYFARTSFTLDKRLCSFNLCSTRPIVSLVP